MTTIEDLRREHSNILNKFNYVKPIIYVAPHMRPESNNDYESQQLKNFWKTKKNRGIYRNLYRACYKAYSKTNTELTRLKFCDFIKEYDCCWSTGNLIKFYSNKYHILYSLERNLFGFITKNEELDTTDETTLNGTYSDIEWDITKLSDCQFIVFILCQFFSSFLFFWSFRQFIVTKTNYVFSIFLCSLIKSLYLHDRLTLDA